MSLDPEEVAYEDEKDLLIKELRAKLQEMESASKMSEKLCLELEGKLNLLSANEKVSVDLESRPHLSTMKEKLVRTFMKDPDLYADLLHMEAPSTVSAFSQRISVGHTDLSRNALPTDPFEAARILSEREGISYTMAFEKVSK